MAGWEGSAGPGGSSPSLTESAKKGSFGGPLCVREIPCEEYMCGGHICIVEHRVQRL